MPREEGFLAVRRIPELSSGLAYSVGFRPGYPVEAVVSGTKEPAVSVESSEYEVVAVTMGQFELGIGEFQSRIARVREAMPRLGVDALVVFGVTRIFYLSGFHLLPTERPVVLILSSDDLALVVPHLEEENIPVRTPWIQQVVVYREYPGPKHPMQYVADFLSARGLASKNLGVDSDGYGAYWGYRGPRLSDLVSAKLTNVANFVDDLKMIKSPAEIDLIRESARFGNLAHTFLQQGIRIGATELELSLKASLDATTSMMGILGPSYEPSSGAGATVSFTSGPKTSFNHRRAGARRIQRGDVLLTGASADIGGYKSELERMLIVGEPSAQVRKFFQLEVEAQNVGFAAIKPGARCSDVERRVNEFLEGRDLLPMTRTHIGHGLGMEAHEAPFLDLGDDTMIRPGMVLSVEPCLFIPGVAGFRHSDTVLVTDTGIDLITYYPRDLESLTVAV